MNYGFVIDNSKCIGCHACSIACKSENEVPLGVYRTWVKYVETGIFPNTRRHFQVTRCNHCANPPCVRICPVGAMYQRSDGIVEFAADSCIGCKACMQACPYDAIYIDPDSGTAAKCHFCAHRIDIGLEPACVVVCPVHAISAGDIDNHDSEIWGDLYKNEVTVRKPEQGTAPKLFYIQGDDAAMHPTATERTAETFMFTEVIPLHGGSHIYGSNGNGNNGSAPLSTSATEPIYANPLVRIPQPQGHPLDGPIQRGGRMADHVVQTSYNAQHKIPWHWQVPAYLVAKGIGTGLFMILSLGVGLNLFSFEAETFVVAGFLSLLFVGINTGLLVMDLEKPARFLTILLRPQWRSWLARGAFLLSGFSALAGMWWMLEMGAYLGWLPETLAASVRPYALWIGLPLAIGSAIYTAFLFGQAEGRDLWQSSLLPIHMLVQALMVGAGMFLLIDFAMIIPAAIRQVAAVIFISALIIDLGMILLGEFGMPHASEIAAKAAHEISHGAYRKHFWGGGIVLGHIIPLVLLAVSIPLAAAAAALFAIIGLYFFEYAFVMAPQDVPNS